MPNGSDKNSRKVKENSSTTEQQFTARSIQEQTKDNKTTTKT